MAWSVVADPRRIEWTLLDDSHPRFDIWMTDTGYRECFLKGEDPNVTKPFGENTTPYTMKGEE